MEEMGYLIRTEAGPRLGIKNKDTYMDATNPDARKFVWQKLKENYFDKGIHLFGLMSVNLRSSSTSMKITVITQGRYLRPVIFILLILPKWFMRGERLPEMKIF